MAVELRNRIDTDLGLELPMIQFLEGHNIDELTHILLHKFDQLQPAPEIDAGDNNADPAKTAVAEEWEEGEL
jgi:hypothetical protein